MKSPKKVNPITKIAVLTSALCMSALIGKAQPNINWQSPVTISAPSDVNTSGAYFGSWAPYDGNANDYPVNGVTFQGYSDLPGFTPGSTLDNGYNGFGSPNTSDHNYNTLLQTAIFSNEGNQPATVSWSGMTQGHTYLVQIWVNDGRNIGQSRSETFAGGANTSAQASYGSDGSGPGQYIIGTFVADSTGAETLTLTAYSSGSAPDPQLNLLQVRDVTPIVVEYDSIVTYDGPLAFYALNPGADGTSTAPDLTGNGNNGVDMGITPAAGPSAFLTNAANFNDAASVDLSQGSNPGLLNFGGPITMEAWVQPANTDQPLTDITAKGYDPSQNNDELTMRANGGNYFGGTYGSQGTQGASGGQQTTNWTYLVCTYDGVNWNLYVNTVLVQSRPDSVGAIDFADDWMIGNGSVNGNGRFFNGNISEVALYDYALTPGQVLNHYYYGEINSSPTNSAPIITSQPQPQSTYVGGSATFSVSVVSDDAVTNQWLKNGSPIAGQTNSTLTFADVQPGDFAAYSVIAGNGVGTTNSNPAALSQVNPASLQWSGVNNNGVWDTGLSTNWVNLANNQSSVFAQGDQVLFGDAVGAPTTMNISNTVTPSLITVNSSANNYTFSNSGTISGSGGLLKEGSSTLTIYNPATFTGPVVVSGGTVYAGNTSLRYVSSITVTNNATVDFGGSDYQNNQPVTVAGAGVNNEGALYNSYNNLPGEALDISLVGDATFGGSQRWDLVGGSISGAHNLTVNWSTNNGYGEWNSLVLAPAAGNIEVAKGALGIKSMGTNFGNPDATITVDPGSQLDFWTGDPGYSKNIHILSGGEFNIYTGFTSFNANVIFENGSQFNSFYGSGAQQMLNGAFTLNGLVHFVLGDSYFLFTNVISGPGGFVWDAYNHEMTLEASNTYTGPTVIGGGLTMALSGNGSISQSSLIFFGGGSQGNLSLDVTQRSDATLTLASGQTLGGVGAINGNLVVSPGATIAPGGTNVILGMTEGSQEAGVLAATGNVNLNGTTAIKLDASGLNDEVEAGAVITFGGALNLTIINGPLAVGSAFQVFVAGGYAGSFNNVVPPTPGLGQAWDFSQLASGIIGVAAAPTINSVVKSDGNLVFSGSGGTPSGNYYVLTATNLTEVNWLRIATNTYDGGGNFTVTEAIAPNAPPQFFKIEQ